MHYGIEVLHDQPSTYRGAILLISGTLDRSGKNSLEDAVRAIEDTNTAIYGFGFSSMLAAVKHEDSQLPGGGTYSTEPYPAGGCMSHDPSADQDAWQSRVRTVVCAQNLLPPLQLARLALLAAKDGL